MPASGRAASPGPDGRPGRDPGADGVRRDPTTDPQPDPQRPGRGAEELADGGHGYRRGTDQRDRLAGKESTRSTRPWKPRRRPPGNWTPRSTGQSRRNGRRSCRRESTSRSSAIQAPATHWSPSWSDCRPNCSARWRTSLPVTWRNGSRHLVGAAESWTAERPGLDEGLDRQDPEVRDFLRQAASRGGCPLAAAHARRPDLAG